MDISFKHSLKLTGFFSPLKKTAETQKERLVSSSKHQFSVAKMLVSRRVTSPPWSWTPQPCSSRSFGGFQKNDFAKTLATRGSVPPAPSNSGCSVLRVVRLTHMLKPMTYAGKNHMPSHQFYNWRYVHETFKQNQNFKKKNQCRNQKFQMVNDWWENHDLPKWIVWAKTYCRRRPCTRKANLMHIGMKWSSCQTLGQSFFKIFSSTIFGGTSKVCFWRSSFLLNLKRMNLQPAGWLFWIQGGYTFQRQHAILQNVPKLELRCRLLKNWAGNQIINLDSTINGNTSQDPKGKNRNSGRFPTQPPIQSAIGPIIQTPKRGGRLSDNPVLQWAGQTAESGLVKILNVRYKKGNIYIPEN